uniref:Uncharacterized protein n=1 Tax=Acrobeloides nanus TaxID=290746 RepID=A0A914DJ54_9BILA
MKGLGSLNVEKSDINTATFVPVGSESQNAQDSNQNNQKDSGLGTGTGRERHNFLSLPGVGSFDVMEKKNDDAALSTILSRIFPTLPEFETLLNNRDKNEPSDQQNSYASHIYNNAQDNAEVNQQKLGEKIVLLHDQMTSIKENELPALQSSLSKQERRSLCKQLSFAFTKFCKGSTTEAKFLPLCQQYYKDCAEFLPEIMPLSHVANFWKSQVGLSPVNWGISGIPYYAINDQGEVSGGQSGKVDFGTYGGGYSDNTGVRDFWNLRREAGANWHKGIYGVNRAWDVPIAKDFGIEGGSGAYVKVPINEHEFGQPIELFTGNHVGPYLGTAKQEVLQAP